MKLHNQDSKDARRAARRANQRRHIRQMVRLVRNGRPRGMKRSTFRKLKKQFGYDSFHERTQRQVKVWWR